MAQSNIRAASLVQVAASADDFPLEIREWLAASSADIATSPDIYDALALIANGCRPAAMIVSLGAIDWNEIEFFDHIRRLSPSTTVYVASRDNEDAKSQAAGRYGVKRFDAPALDRSLQRARVPADVDRGDNLFAGAVSIVGPG